VEVTVDALPVEGDLPEWLAGTLIRNGPARYGAANGRSLRHWFDGQAMLHRFEIAGGAVSYANRFVDTPNYRSLRDNGRIGYTEFATDPCGSLFSRFFTRFFGKPGVNPAVNIVTFGESAAAVTETPLAVEFDPATLATVRVTDYNDGMNGALTTAHPHADPTTGSLVNYLLKFGRRSSYQVYRQDGNGRRLIGSVPVEQPGYVHSFAITERYVVLVIFPLVVNPLSLLLPGKPFIENYRWRPELGTRIVVIDSADGSIRGSYETEACFAFHHINAWDDGGTVVVDLCGYPDASVIDALYLDSLRDNRGLPLALPIRLTVQLTNGRVSRETLADEPLELPNIDYSRRNGRPYRFAYGVGARDRSGHNFLDQLVKIDTATGGTETWYQDGCYPGEPVFVATPTAAEEDDGVLLSVVLDANSGRSFLLVLNARTCQELSRAHVPQAVPFGFHGKYLRSSRV
jgi:carotenoid cleavage dioxygenase-like enzyme